MPPLNEEIYLAMVDNTMKKLRAICLGQDAPLTSILPPHLKDRPAAQQAEIIADQLLFALAKTDHSASTPQQLADSRLWLRDTTLYLLTERRPSSQTFEELKSILGLEPNVRRLLFTSFSKHSFKALTGGPPPELLKDFDSAFLRILKEQGRFEAAKAAYEKFDSLRKS